MRFFLAVLCVVLVPLVVWTAHTTSAAAPAALTLWVAAPNGGEIWFQGETRNITWCTSGPTSSISGFWVAYSLDCGCKWTQIKTAAKSSRSLSWTVPSTASSVRTLIWVKALDSRGNTLAADGSDGPFTTVSPIYDKTSRDSRFGRFNYRDLQEGNIEIHPAWVAANIVTVQLPVLGKVKIHRLAEGTFRKAVTLIQQKNLGSLVKKVDCTWFARRAYNDPNAALSLHSWGIAVDINKKTNPEKGPPSADNRKLWEEAFKPAGFQQWGGNWTKVDGMHFELAL
jgi:hypothetical protein